MEGAFGAVAGFAELGWDFVVCEGVVDGAGAGGFGRLIVPLLVVEHLEGFLHLLDLGDHGGALVADEVEALLDGGVALEAPVDEGFDVFDGHAGLFEALDDGEPFEVLVLEHADAAARAFDEGEEPFFIVVAQR